MCHDQMYPLRLMFAFPPTVTTDLVVCLGQTAT